MPRPAMGPNRQEKFSQLSCVNEKLLMLGMIVVIGLGSKLNQAVEGL
jgi:hypothetical protein